MSPKKVLLWIALVLSLTSLAIPNVIAASSAPFIYYYADAKQAFIVERADGTESRILANYTMPDSLDTRRYMYIAGPGWSSSGEWFAWTSRYGFGTGGSWNVFVVQRDGKTQLQVFPHEVTVRYMLWSPTANLLLITYYESDPEPFVSDSIVIYDPLAQKVIRRAVVSEIFSDPEPELFLDYYHIYGASWSPDGNSIALDTEPRIAIMDVAQGTFILRMASSASGMGFICTHPSQGSLVHWLSNGRITYFHHDFSAIVIEDLRTETQEIIKLPIRESYEFDWSPDEKYVLVYMSPIEKTAQLELWMLSIAEHSAEPLNLNVDYIWPICELPFYGSAWNRHNQAGVTINNKLWVVSTSPTRLSKVVPPVNGEMQARYGFQWLPNGNLMFIWSLHMEGSTLYTRWNKIYSYTPNTGQLNQILPTTGQPQEFEAIFFIPLAENFLGYIDKEDAHVLDTATGLQSQIQFKKRPASGDFYSAYLIGHPTQHWLFLFSDNVESQRFVNVVNYAGTIQRQMALCRPEIKSCYGWLPDLVEQAQLF